MKKLYFRQIKTSDKDIGENILEGIDGIIVSIGIQSSPNHEFKIQEHAVEADKNFKVSKSGILEYLSDYGIKSLSFQQKERFDGYVDILYTKEVDE